MLPVEMLSPAYYGHSSELCSDRASYICKSWLTSHGKHQLGLEWSSSLYEFSKNVYQWNNSNLKKTYSKYSCNNLPSARAKQNILTCDSKHIHMQCS